MDYVIAFTMVMLTMAVFYSFRLPRIGVGLGLVMTFYHIRMIDFGFVCMKESVFLCELGIFECVGISLILSAVIMGLFVVGIILALDGVWIEGELRNYKFENGRVL